MPVRARSTPAVPCGMLHPCPAPTPSVLPPIPSPPACLPAPGVYPDAAFGGRGQRATHRHRQRGAAGAGYSHRHAGTPLLPLACCGCALLPCWPPCTLRLWVPVCVLPAAHGCKASATCHAPLSPPIFPDAAARFFPRAAALLLPHAGCAVHAWRRAHRGCGGVRRGLPAHAGRLPGSGGPFGVAGGAAAQCGASGGSL